MKTFKKTLIAASIAISTSTFANNHIAQVDSHGHIKKDFVLTQEARTVVVPLVKTVKTHVETISYSGQDAIDFLGDKIIQVAEEHHSDVNRFKQMLLSDFTLRVDKNGKLFAVDHATLAGKSQASTVAYTGDVSKLHSKPGAKKIIYLDTDGFDPTGTGWQDAKSGSLTGWSTSNGDVYTLWTVVAEDFAPFDIDVTTEEPNPDALLKSSDTDEEFGTRVVITDSASTLFCKYGCGGLAYVNSANWLNNETPCLVFVNSAGVYGKTVAEAVSHEIGHTLNLLHDGTSTSGYYGGNDNWAPIMGASYGARHSQFSKGEYPDANNHEDDLDIINRTVPYDTDTSTDISSAISVETKTTSFNSATIKQIDAIISNSTDKDYYSFVSAGGKATFIVTPRIIPVNSAQNVYANLKPKVSILDSVGTVIATGTYGTGITDEYEATVSADVPVGTYYIMIEGVGDQYFTAYGSIGQYSLTGTYTDSHDYASPVAISQASITSGVGPLTVTFDATASTVGYGSSLKYRWRFGDYSTSETTSIATHTFNSTGIHTVTLTVTNEAGLSSSMTTQIDVKAPLIGLVKVKNPQVKISYNKSVDLSSAKVSYKLVTEKGKGVKKARVCGFFTGSFNDKLNNNIPYHTCGTTNSNGSLTINYPTGYVYGKHGTLTFTIYRVESSQNLVLDSASQLIATLTK